MTFCLIWQFNINTFWTARIWPAWSFNSDRTKHTPSDFQCHICLASVVFLRLFFKLKVSSWAFLEARQIFLETHCRFELNFMTSWGIVSDKVIVVSADGILEVKSADTTITLSFLLGCYNKRRWLLSRMTSLQVMYYFGYAETFTIPSDRSGMVAICVARQPPSGPEVKMGCIELCNFHFCCASIFCQPMKKFEFFGATRATRQRHSKRVALGTRMVQYQKGSA